jgi:NAD(P)H-dependent flavin oxidoreductase YrpB (nitropropane dioxygenase family)
MRCFRIIQGGMGVGVSGWPLARAVAQLGQLGVVSGTGLAVVLARRLQDGDPGGHLRRALAHFPVPNVANRVLEHYFVAGGKPDCDPYAPTPVPKLPLARGVSDQRIEVEGNMKRGGEHETGEHETGTGT